MGGIIDGLILGIVDVTYSSIKDNLTRKYLTKRLLNNSQNPKDYFAFVELCLKQKTNTPLHNETALAVIRKLLDFEPNNLEAMSIECQLLLYTGQIDEALRKLEEIIPKKPTAKNYYFLTACYAKKGDIEKARVNQDKAIALDRNWAKHKIV